MRIAIPFVVIAAMLVAGCANMNHAGGSDVDIGTPDLERSLAREVSVTVITDASMMQAMGIGYGSAFVAMNGYDPVHMLETGGEKVRGSPEYAVVVYSGDHERGVAYWFRTRKNARMFTNDIDRYRPKYGGFCGWGVVDYRNVEDGRPLNVSHATPVPPVEQGGVYIVRDADTEDARIIGFLNDTVRDWFMAAPDFYERIADHQWEHNREDVLVPWSAIADEVRALRSKQEAHSH